MAKKKFNWKGLFINEEHSETGNTTQKNEAPEIEKGRYSFPEQTVTTNTFPNHQNNQKASSFSSSQIDESILDKILIMYEKGFDSLNISGYDFYEFFKAIKAVNSEDASIYKMALSMGQSIDSKINKSTLLKQSEFYIKEIEKVHTGYKKQGEDKKSQILTKEKNNKNSLTKEISSLEKQILEIQNAISQKKNELTELDANLNIKAVEIEQKIAANNIAKETILRNIKNVVLGIKNNL